MEFLKNNMVLLGGVFAVGGLVWIYFVFFSGGSSEELLSQGEVASPVSQELLVTLSNLRTIKLDETVFEDPVFMSLSDFGVTIPPEPVGRRNPFAPVGASAGSAQSLEAPVGVE